MRVQLTPEARAESLIEALPYIQKFRGRTFVIKYGGAAMEEDQIVDRFLRDIVFLEAVGINPVLVHGGGKAITARMRDADLKPQFVNGLRVTDEIAMGIVENTLDNEINPKIVETIIKFGGNAQGFSGKSVFVARRLPPQRKEDGEQVDIGFVGEATRINADVAAAALASAIKAAKLIYVSDVPGIMRDPASSDSLIPTVHSDQIEPLIKEKVIDGGMIPKVQSAVGALKNGVGMIHLIGGNIQHCILLETFTNSGIGTEIVQS